MTVSPLARAAHIKKAIGEIREILRGKTQPDALADRLSWLAFERLLEIVSEASRGIPSEMLVSFGPELPWRDIGDLGNVLRHGYHHLQAPILWDIYQNRLDPLEAAIDRMLAANPLPPSRS